MTYISGSITSITNPHNAGDTGHVTDHNNLVSAASGHDLILSSPSILFSSSALLSGLSTISSSAFMSILNDETGTGAVVFNTSPTFTGLVSGSSLNFTADATIGGNLNVSGSVFVSGSAFTVSGSSLTISDPMIYMATGNPANLNDIGIVGHFTSGSYQHTGLVRDHNDSIWKLFSGVNIEPSNVMDFSSATYDTIRTGGLQVNSSSTVTSASITSAGVANFASLNTSGAASVAGNLTASVNNVYLSTTASMGSSPILSASNVQTVTGKTLTTASISGTGLIYLGSTSGSSTIVASSAAGTGTLTLPVGTDTLVGASITQILSGKSLSSASINAGSFSGTITNTALINGGSFSTASIGSGSFGGTITNGAVINGGSYSTASINAGSFSGTITNTATISGGTFTLATASALQLSAGTTASPTLYMASGALLTNAVANALEWDGNNLYFTPNTSLSRSIIPTAAIVTSSATQATLTNATTAVNLFPTGDAAIAVPANSTYEFELYFATSGSAAASAVTATTLQFAGTASATASISYVAMSTSNTAAGTAAAANMVYGTTTAAVTLIPATTNIYRTAYLKGTLRIGATSGSIIPQIAYSVAPSFSSSINAGAYMKIIPIGASAVQATAGWL